MIVRAGLNTRLFVSAIDVALALPKSCPSLLVTTTDTLLIFAFGVADAGFLFESTILVIFAGLLKPLNNKKPPIEPGVPSDFKYFFATLPPGYASTVTVVTAAAAPASPKDLPLLTSPFLTSVMP